MTSTEKNNILYTAHKINFAFRDQDTKPCFGVQRIASCFLSQIDSIAQSQANNLCMFGIFGQWGRGKTYLWQQIREIITKWNCDKNDQHIHYDIVEFNAWKYQDTPALWAYLYQTICDAMPWMRYICYIGKLWKTWQKLLGVLVMIGLALSAIYVLLDDYEALIPTWIAIASLSIERLIEIYKRGKVIMPHNLWSKEYQNALGVQNELENSLEKLLCTWVCKRQISRHRILLYVDDIDRCDEDKMISILDSLRTILENPEIQKRLVVVCSLDRDRIVAAIQKKYLPTQPNDGNPAQRNIVTEQLDKLFIFSVGLPQLDTTQQQRFIDCLSQNTAKEQDKLPYSTARTEQSLYSTTVGAQQDKQISEKEIIAWLHKFIEDKKDYSLTPRKLRIIYYRMLFANNLMADQNEVYFTEQFAQNIFDHSIHREIGDSLVNQCFSDILETVVPY